MTAEALLSSAVGAQRKTSMMLAAQGDIVKTACELKKVSTVAGTAVMPSRCSVSLLCFWPRVRNMTLLSCFEHLVEGISDKGHKPAVGTWTCEEGGILHRAGLNGVEKV